MKPKYLFVILLTALCLMAALPVHAQTAAGVQMKASAAYGGNYKYGEWLPVWVELENQGRDLTAEVRVQVPGSGRTTTFVAPVSLPSGSHKRLPVYVLANNFSRQLTINLVSDNKVVTTQTVDIHPQPNITFLVGLVTPERGALGLVSGISIPGQSRPVSLVDVQLADLPERPEALRSLDVLMINNTDTSKLTPAQKNTLQSWVSSGGRLVLGGGSGAPQTFAGIPDTLLPAKLQGSTEITADSLGALAEFAAADRVQTSATFVAAVGQVQSAAGARVLVGTDALPLVIEKTLDSGHVDFVALDLSTAPFNGWAGTQAFWEKLLSPGAEYDANLPFDSSLSQMRANQLSYALSNIPSLDLPSVQGLSLLLLVYILAVGPLNYILLRRINRLHLAWVTIPIITLLFTGGAFGLGYLMRGNDLILNRVAILDMQAGGNAQVTSYMGLFSPSQQSYEITVQGEGLVSPMNASDPGVWNQTAPVGGAEMSFIQGQPSTIKGLTVSQFSMQAFMSEEIWANFGKLTSDLYMENDTLKGTVRNDTAYPLNDVVVAIQNRFQKLGNLTPGQEVKVDLGLGNLSLDRSGMPLSYRLFQEQDNPNGVPLSRAAQLKTTILDTVSNNGYASKFSNFAPSGGQSKLLADQSVLIIAWLDQAPPVVKVNNNALSQQTTALLYKNTSFRFPVTGLIQIPAGLIPGAVTKFSAQGGECGMPGAPAVNMASGEAEFEFTLPADLKGVTFTNLKINVRRDGSPATDAPDLNLWDWKAKQWMNIQKPILGTNEVHNPAALINENGVVRVSLKNNDANFSCIYLDLGVDAQRGAQVTP